MECNVLSPCGKYIVEFSTYNEIDANNVTNIKSIYLNVYYKDKTNSVYYSSILSSSTVEQITSDAGVYKSIDKFANMIKAALVRSLPDVLQFSISTIKGVTEKLFHDKYNNNNSVKL